MFDDLQRSLSCAMEQCEIAGAQLSVYCRGTNVDVAAGTANTELGIPMTTDVLVQVGSVTKLCNAVIMMSLVEEGRLSLDEPVKNIIPSFQLATVRAAEKITLRHLLSMSSGLDNGDYASYGSGEDALRRRITGLRDTPMHFEPGSHFGYSNASTDIAGYLAETVTEKLWDDLLQERVIDALGMKNAATLDWQRLYHRVAVGHRNRPGENRFEVLRQWSMPRGLSPAGATLTASASDIVRLGVMFLRKGASASGGRVLQEETIANMFESQIQVPVHRTASSWCLGPCFYKSGDVGVWGHPGGNISGASHIYIVPQKDLVVAWTMNTPSNRSKFEKAISETVLRRYFDFQMPKIRKPDQQIDVDNVRYTGTYRSLRGDCHVTIVTNRLHVTKRWKNFANESLVDHDEFFLDPLGNDRFLVDRTNGNKLTEPQEDMAFFNSGTDGLMSNLICYVHACSRQH